MSDVLFPTMSEEQGASGVVVNWYVETGDTVTPDTLIAEVAMDKIDADVYPSDAGVITLVVAEEAEVAQGSVIATIA